MWLRELTRPLAVPQAAPLAAAGRALEPVAAAPPLARIEARPPLSPSPLLGLRRVAPSLRTISFVAVVLLPIAVGAAYYFAVAADQYVAEFRFTLSTAEPARLDPLSVFAGNAAHAPAALESQVLVQYMTSRAIVDRLDGVLDLRRLLAAPQADWWARLPAAAPIEEVVRYWKGQVDPFYDPATGSVTVRVRAFAAADALRLSDAIVAACERLVNDLSARARRDALQQSEAELAHAEVRLKSVLAEIRIFRDREGLIDPAKTAEATGALATRLREELVRANTQLATLRSYMRDDAPSIKVLRARIRALLAQQRGLAHELTGNSARSDTLSGVLAAYDALQSEQKFAETAYQHALQSLDQARANADRQRVFVASFVPPSLPEAALYPRRWRSLATIALFALALWAIGGLALQSIRDHLA